MGVIIDTNVVSMVFDSKNANHNEFKPVLDSLLNRKAKCKLVYGGTKYRQEVNSFKKHLDLLVTLNQLGKTIILNDDEVDIKQKEIENALIAQGKDPINDDNYNDCHIVAMAAVGKAKVIISNDYKSIPLIRTREYYKHTKYVPVFYTSSRNIRLIQDPSYMANC